MQIKQFGFFFLLGIILAATFKFYQVVDGYIPSIASACVLAYLSYPLFLYLAKRFLKRTMAALMVVLIVFGVVLLPLVLILYAVQGQIANLFQDQTLRSLQNVATHIQAFIEAQLDVTIPDEVVSNLQARFVNTMQNVLAVIGQRMISGITTTILSVFVMFFVLYYLLMRGPNVISTFKNYFPLSFRHSEQLLRELGHETRTLVFGQLLIATMQGILGGIGFAIFGVGDAILWGLVMALLSFIPFVGTGFVWVPASIILLLRENYMPGVGLFIWGMIVVGTSDNLIRPKLTSTLGRIHPVTVLLGVLIGIQEWGVVGLVIGPLFISILFNLIRMFREEYIEE